MNLTKIYRKKLIKSPAGVKFLKRCHDSYLQFETRYSLFGALRYMLKEGLIPEWEFNILASVINLSDEEKSRVNY